MKINSKTRYGLRVLLELATNSDEKHNVLQKDIAREQGISEKYLDQVILGLKKGNLIKNISKKRSGYMLTRPTNEITLFDIYSIFTPGNKIIECLDHSMGCDRKGGCAPMQVWTELGNKINNYMKSITIESIVDLDKKLINSI